MDLEVEQVEMTPEVAKRRFRQTLQLWDMGLQITRQRFRREHPDWDEAQVQQAMREWMDSKPFFPGWPRSTRFD